MEYFIVGFGSLQEDVTQTKPTIFRIPRIFELPPSSGPTKKKSMAK